jgi:hypothetical protein
LRETFLYKKFSSNSFQKTFITCSTLSLNYRLLACFVHKRRLLNRLFDKFSRRKIYLQ